MSRIISSQIFLAVFSVFILTSIGALASTPREQNCGSIGGWKFTATQFDSGVMVRVYKNPSEDVSTVSTLFLKNIDPTRPFESDVKPVVFNGQLVSFKFGTATTSPVLSVGPKALTCK